MAIACCPFLTKCCSLLPCLCSVVTYKLSCWFLWVSSLVYANLIGIKTLCFVLGDDDDG
jgi:hypothetical protein